MTFIPFHMTNIITPYPNDRACLCPLHRCFPSLVRIKKPPGLFAVRFSGQLRGVDSNHRPPGYEPDELPLLYPASS